MQMYEINLKIKEKCRANIRESNHPLLKEGGFLWFKEDEKRSFRITVQDVDIAKGLY